MREPDDIVTGTIEVGCNDKCEVVINLPKLETDADGISYITFSPRQARRLANLLLRHSVEAVQEWQRKAKVKRG